MFMTNGYGGPSWEPILQEVESALEKTRRHYVTLGDTESSQLASSYIQKFKRWIPDPHLLSVSDERHIGAFVPDLRRVLESSANKNYIAVLSEMYDLLSKALPGDPPSKPRNIPKPY
jgi:hypothetical protein